jgi:UDP-N-acetylglucosamine 2-epimerase (non-hydrolysing)
MTNLLNRGPILIVAGTRPEVIKLAPVYHRARLQLGEKGVQWISTGQHEKLETETLRNFQITPTHRLMVRDRSDSVLAVNEQVIRGLANLINDENPAMVLVQGDTVSTFAAAFSAFHSGVPIAHVEAGLRTYNSCDPFPEEAYRRMIAPLASVHFAPTRRAAENLHAEGFTNDTIYVTGNTVVDALRLIDAAAKQRGSQLSFKISPGKRLVLVTLHRRESWGTPMREMCLAIREVCERFEDIEVVFPLHVNPLVREVIQPILGDVPRIHLLPPLDYSSFHDLMRRSCLILTDSGGVQEEAPSYGVPVLVLRRVTERQEAIDQGFAFLTGVQYQRIIEDASRLLADKELDSRLSGLPNPFGDGLAAVRIVTAIKRFLSDQKPLLAPDEQFPG